jgi:hypothetical protein
LVRSSYKAGEFFLSNMLRERGDGTEQQQQQQQQVLQAPQEAALAAQ